MNQRIAFFDFDGTITTKDTLLEFIKFSKGPLLFGLGFLLTSPWVVAYKLKLISNQQAKEKVLQFFFSKEPLSRFQEVCDRFGATAIPGLLRPKALQEIEKLKAAGFDIVIVSASPENWIRAWAGCCFTGTFTRSGRSQRSSSRRVTAMFRRRSSRGSRAEERIQPAAIMRCARPSLSITPYPVRSVPQSIPITRIRGRC